METTKLFMGKYPLTLEQAKIELNSLEHFINNVPKGLKVSKENLTEFSELKKFVENFNS